jgi:hypothetical protein
VSLVVTGSVVGPFAALAVDTEQMAAQLQLPVEKLNPEGVVALLAEILRDLPSLPEAACGDQYQSVPAFVQFRTNARPWCGPEYQREHVKRAATCPVQAKCPTVVTTSTTSIALAVGVRRGSTRVRPRRVA